MTESQDVIQKPPRTEPAKSTLPQPGKPVPSRAYPGALIVVEGTDGSGKSTQLYLLKRWVGNLYRFAPVPDITFYFRAPLDVAVHRILSGRPKLKYYEAGMDLGMSYDRAESFRLFQARILEEYDKMVDTDNFVVLDGTL